MKTLNGKDRKILENTKPEHLGLFHGHPVIQNGNNTTAIILTQEFPGQNILRTAIQRLTSK